MFLRPQVYAEQEDGLTLLEWPFFDQLWPLCRSPRPCHRLLKQFENSFEVIFVDNLRVRNPFMII